MRSKMEVFLLAVTVMGLLLTVAYNALVSMCDKKLVAAEASLGRVEETLRAADKSSPSGAREAAIPPRDDSATLRSLIERAQGAVKEHQDLFGAVWEDPFKRTEAEWERAKALVELCGPLIAEIVAFTESSPACPLPKISPDTLKDVWGVEGTYLLAELLAASAEVAHNTGDTTTAERYLKSVFHLVSATRGGTLRQNSCWGFGQRALAWVFRPEDFAEDQRKDLLALVENAMPDRRSLARVLAVDAQMTSARISDEFCQEVPLVQVPYLNGAAITLTKPLRANAGARLTATAEECMELAQHHYYEVRGKIDDIARRVQGRFHYVQPFSWKESEWIELFAEQVKNEALMDLLRISVALAEYRKEHGAYPPSLDAVASRFGGRVPFDPFTGQPYRYRASGNGFVLYSAGPNQVDENGNGDDVSWP